MNLEKSVETPSIQETSTSQRETSIRGVPIRKDTHSGVPQDPRWLPGGCWLICTAQECIWLLLCTTHVAGHWSGWCRREQDPTPPQKSPTELCQLMPLVSHLGIPDVKGMAQGAPLPGPNHGGSAESEAAFKDQDSCLPHNSTC